MTVAPLLAAAANALRAGQPAAAVPLLEAAARQRPDDATLLHDLGLACLECGRLPQAIGALRAAVARNPVYADAHLRLGIALERAGDAEAALAAYARAVAVRPGLADARYRAGALLEQLGRIEEAVAAFRRAAAGAPRSLLGRIAIARALLGESRHGEAEPHLRRALAMDGENAEALELLGTALTEVGRFDEARPLLLRAIDRDPRRAGLYDEVARCRRLGPGDARLLAAMAAAAARPDMDPVQRGRVHLALGRAADEAGDPGAAMQHYDAAAALRDGVLRFDAASFATHIDALIARFTAGAIEATPARHPSAVPILIVGLPRSGTTLVEQILAAHPAVGAGGELPFWNRCGARLAAGIDPAWAGDYVALLARTAPGAARVTDKMPLNFQWAGLIHACLPNAIIVHCRRDLRDTAVSIHRTHFNVRSGFPTGGAALVAYVRHYQRLMAHWRAVLPPDRLFAVEYEALATDPEPTIRRLLAACGLAWDPACLAPERRAAVVRTPSKWQVRQPIGAGAIGGWRRYAPFLGEFAPIEQER